MPRNSPNKEGNESTNSLMLGLADDVILSDLARYHYLTCRQVCRLRYSAGSLTYVQTRLKRLGAANYCQRLFLPRPSQFGSAPSVYTLSSKGLRYLRKSGRALNRRYRPSE